MCAVGMSEASCCCDYPLPVCGPWSGHIDKVHIVQGAHHSKDASSKGHIVQEGCIVQGRIIPKKRSGMVRTGMQRHGIENNQREREKLSSAFAFLCYLDVFIEVLV